jgi:hypothetical protein
MKIWQAVFYYIVMIRIGDRQRQRLIVKNKTKVLSIHLLIDFYQLLTPHNFVLGKITPEGVKFKDYILFDEDFQGPDYLAVHKSRQDIIDKVK